MCGWHEWANRQEAAKRYLQSECRKSSDRALNLCVLIRMKMANECVKAQAKGKCRHYKTDCAYCSLCVKQEGRAAASGWCKRSLFHEASCVKLPEDRLTMKGTCVAEPSNGWSAETHGDCPIYAEWTAIYRRAFKLYSNGHSADWYSRTLLNMAGREPRAQEYASELTDPMFLGKLEMENPIEQYEEQSV